MTPGRNHSQATVALEEIDFLGTQTPVAQEFASAAAHQKHSGGESLGVISVTASLLALNGVLLGELARPLHFESSQDSTSGLQHPSICAAKRAFDFIFALCALIVLLPLFTACAVAMRAESAGPLFFRQRRLGKNSIPFQILKFRTMVPNAETVLAAYLAVDPVAKAEWEADRKLKKDPRITRVGAIMRKLSLDELPQFWNVLKGEMSIVGPRPIVQAEVHYYGDDFTNYVAVRPGITGLWQVSGRNDVSYPNRVALDCSYVRGWSTLLDLRIIAKTVSAVLRAAGAY